MSVGSSTRGLRFILAMLALPLSLLGSPCRLSPPAQAMRAAAGNTYVVNSTADSTDNDVGNPACADASGQCTLRAAIMQANFVTGPDTITLPSGVYLLTRPGNDDADVLGDLDIADDLTLQGAGSGMTVVDGNGVVTGDRVIQILSSAHEVNISDLTIRNGRKTASPFDQGGGLLWEGGGGHLRLHNIVVEGNTASYEGGLSLDDSSGGGAIDLDNVTVHANTATAAAGGLGVNLTTSFGGFSLQNSRIYSNTAYEGGGLYLQGTSFPFNFYSARIESVDIYSNTASLSGGFENRAGSAAVPIVMLASHLHNNTAGFYGGAIGNYGTLIISSILIDQNTAASLGGAFYNYEGGQADVEQSTLSGNTAQSGGGIYSELFIHNNAQLTLANSTLSGNAANHDGAGLYATGGQINLLNTTIANNHILVPLGTFYAGMGGGVYITATAVITAHNLLLGDNTHRYGINLPEPDDCYAAVISLHSLGYNLIETPANCLLSGTTSGNITAQDPHLGPLQNNGGSTPTHALLAGSPAINGGDNTMCPPIDQRGFRRPIGAACDIGAVEYSPYALFLPRNLK